MLFYTSKWLYTYKYGVRVCVYNAHVYYKHEVFFHVLSSFKALIVYLSHSVVHMKESHICLLLTLVFLLLLFSLSHSSNRNWEDVSVPASQNWKQSLCF